VRLHPQRTSRTGSARERLAVARPDPAQKRWFVPVREVLVYPERCLAHAASIQRAPLSKAQRLSCYYELVATVMRWLRMRGGSVLLRRA
jgi:hypothetical protein